MKVIERSNYPVQIDYFFSEDRDATWFTLRWSGT